MKAHDAVHDGFPPPNDRWWHLLNTTPLRDVVRGRLTGSLDPHRSIAAANLPDPVAALLWQMVRRVSRRRRARLQTARELIAYCRRRLAAGCGVEELATSFADPRAKAGLLSKVRDPQLALEQPFPAEVIEWLARVLRKIPGGVGEKQKFAALWRERLLAELMTKKDVQSLLIDLGTPTEAAALSRNCPAVLEARLPLTLSRLVMKVVRATRLRRGERSDVARELSGHFTDGLESGRAADDLLKDFGDPKLAARLIRRAKLRNRPLIQRALRRAGQVAAATFAGLFVIWVGLWLRFVSGSPAVNRDFLAEIDREAAAVPGQDRAWPLYREVLLKADIEKFAPPPKDEKTAGEYRHDFMSAMDQGPSHPRWPEVHAALATHAEDLRLLREATGKPELGFSFFDAANGDWLTAYKRTSPLYDKKKPLFHTLLPHAQEMRWLNTVLTAEMQHAVAEKNGAEVTAILNAKLDLSRHARQTSPFIVSLFVSRAVFLKTLDDFTHLVIEQPDLLSDDDLRRLAHRVAAFEGGGKLLIDLSGERMVLEDIVQRTYTDDGQGDGRITLQGFELLNDELQPVVLLWNASSPPVLHKELSFTERLSAAWGKISDKVANPSGPAARQIFGPGAAVGIASRAEMLHKMDDLLARFQQDLMTPAWKRGEGALATELDRMQSQPNEAWRYRFLLPFFQGWGSIETNPDGWTGIRDAALVTIALELHRRKTGEWPDGLQELVPQLLPEVPPDMFDGRPLRYRVVAGKPLLYSIGADKDDDGGSPPTAPPREHWRADHGDWIFLPVQKSEP